MNEATRLDTIPFRTTDGEIAVVNLDSIRLRSWSRFFANPLQSGLAETVIEHEQLTAQFVGDLSSLDRLEYVVEQLVELDGKSARTAIIRAQIASMAHRFSDARHYLAQAEVGGAPAADVKRLRLNIDQACGVNLASVLDERRRVAEKSGRIEDLVPLAALLADLRQFPDADRSYRQALGEYRDVSPFAPAWVCFQLGVLWGELVPEAEKAHAADWYRSAVEYLPGYTKARVHLAEVYSDLGRMSDAETLLVPALSSGDPEVCWRLADVMAAQGKSTDADAHMLTAHCGYERLLERHVLAFADHGAEFYAGSGNDAPRALKLAQINAANRPTLRAFEQAHSIAVYAGNAAAASELLHKATKRWGGTAAFGQSSLGKDRLENREGAAA